MNFYDYFDRVLSRSNIKTANGCVCWKINRAVIIRPVKKLNSVKLSCDAVNNVTIPTIFWNELDVKRFEFYEMFTEVVIHLKLNRNTSTFVIINR